MFNVGLNLRLVIAVNAPMSKFPTQSVWGKYRDLRYHHQAFADKFVHFGFAYVLVLVKQVPIWVFTKPVIWCAVWWFTRAIGTNQSHNFALLNVQIQIRHGLNATVVDIHFSSLISSFV